MNYFPFFYHILNRTHIKNKTRIHTTFNHFPFHKVKYTFLPCSSPFFSHNSVTQQHHANVNDNLLIF